MGQDITSEASAISLGPELTAYLVRPGDGWTIEPSGPKRDWMDQTTRKAAYRCLPLVMANQAGWIVPCPVSFKAVWDKSKPEPGNLTFEFSEREDVYSKQIISLFGSGIITFSLPWLFRTSDRVGLFVRGATNFYREGLSPLDGLVETDWAPYTFTMNWKIHKPKTPIWFRKGDPVCMLMPFPLDFLETIEPVVKPIATNEMLEEDFETFCMHRRAELREVAKDVEGFQFDLKYMRGRKPDGEPAPDHKTNFTLRKFEDQT